MNDEVAPLFPEPIFTPKPTKKVNSAGYKVVSVRLREPEFISLSEQSASCGITNNMALRIAARRISGFLEIDPATRDMLQDISDSIGDISDSIRELSVVSRATNDVNLAEFAKCRAAFGADFIVLDRQLRTLLNVSRRRTDGAKLIREIDT